MQKCAARNGATRVQRTGPHPRLSYWGGGGNNRLAEDVTTRRAALAAPPRRPSWFRYSALSSPKPGDDAPDTHAFLISGQQWPETRHWRRHGGSWPPAAGSATRVARRPPWPRRRQAAEDKRGRAPGGGPEAAAAQARPAPRVCKPDPRGPAKSARESKGHSQNRKKVMKGSQNIS